MNRRAKPLGSIALLAALALLAGCNRHYYQDISAAQYAPDPGFGQGRAMYRPVVAPYAAPPTPMAQRPFLTLAD